MRPRFGSWVVLSTCVLALLLMLWAELGRADPGAWGYSEAGESVSSELCLTDQRFRQGNTMVGAVPIVVEHMLGRQ